MDRYFLACCKLIADVRSVKEIIPGAGKGDPISFVPNTIHYVLIADDRDKS